MLPDVGVDRSRFRERGAGVDEQRSGAAPHQPDRDVAERQPAAMHAGGQLLPGEMHREEESGHQGKLSAHVGNSRHVGNRRHKNRAGDPCPATGWARLVRCRPPRLADAVTRPERPRGGIRDARSRHHQAWRSVGVAGAAAARPAAAGPGPAAGRGARRGGELRRPPRPGRPVSGRAETSGGGWLRSRRDGRGRRRRYRSRAASATGSWPVPGSVATPRSST